MSGWIKLEKDLREDQRVKRMARGLNQRPMFCNAPALLCVTLVLGGLAQLWMHADSFARDDDTLDISPEEVDELTGIQGFAELLPEDWFQVLDAHRVKLPEFQAHNGSEAKRKAQTARRVAQHRDKEKREAVTTCDPPVTQVRYQTRPDQTKTRPKEESARAEALAVPGLDLKAWEEWISYRAERKPSIKPASLLAAAQELASFGDQQAAVVKHSKAQGYQGLFAPKASGINGRHPEDTGWRPPEAKR